MAGRALLEVLEKVAHKLGLIEDVELWAAQDGCCHTQFDCGLDEGVIDGADISTA